MGFNKWKYQGKMKFKKKKNLGLNNSRPWKKKNHIINLFGPKHQQKHKLTRHYSLLSPTMQGLEFEWAMNIVHINKKEFF